MGRVAPGLGLRSRRFLRSRPGGLPKSTYYYGWQKAFRRGGGPALKPRSTRPRSVRRWRWTDPDAQAVLKLRDQYPFMGKLRLKAMLDRQGVCLSVSTVGRIEFWNSYDGPLSVSDVALKLLEYEFFHDYLRPHTALDCRTPDEYLVQVEEACRSAIRVNISSIKKGGLSPSFTHDWNQGARASKFSPARNPGQSYIPRCPCCRPPSLLEWLQPEHYRSAR